MINAIELEGAEAADCFYSFGKKRGWFSKILSKIRIPKIHISFRKTVVEIVKKADTDNSAASGRNDASLSRVYRFRGSGTVDFDAFDFEDGLRIVDLSTGNQVFNDQMIQGQTGPITLNAGRYRVDVTGHTDPNDPRGSIWDLDVTDNSQRVIKKTKYKLLGITIFSRVEKQTVDFTTGTRGPKIVVRKFLGIPYFRKVFETQPLTLSSNAVGRRRPVRNRKVDQLPELKKL